MAKKTAKKIAGKDADQYMLRLPDGLRDRVAKRATENGRSMNTEIIEAIEKRQDLIPTDNYKPLDMAQLCANDEETPYDVPLHPGASRFYREKSYLK